MYGFEVRTGLNFADSVAKVTEALQAEGFGVLTDIDVAATFKKKLAIDRRPYRILGACNPALANVAISADEDIGLLLPCNVVVREDDNDEVVVALMNPQPILALAGNDDITQLGKEVGERLQRVRDVMSA